MGKYCRQHIGKTFNGGKLTVVDGGDNKKGVKVKCGVCAEDVELFGDAIYETDYTALAKGHFPCGCSRSPRWTLLQHAVRINRKISSEKLPVKFIGFGETHKQITQTPIRLSCYLTAQEYIVSSISKFFEGRGNYGARTDTNLQILDYNTKNNGKSFVWDTGKKSNNNWLLGYYCKTCEGIGHEYIFTVNSSKLFNKGTIPCHCSKSQNTLTTQYVLDTVNLLLVESELKDVLVVGAQRQLTNSHWNVFLFCQIHGIYSRSMANIRARGGQCLKCTPSKTGYNITLKGYLYLIDIEWEQEKLIGYGITNNFDYRLMTHKTNLSKIDAVIKNITIFEGSGECIQTVEREIKSLHPFGLLPCTGFRRESISIDMKDKVLEKCKKLKQLDNVDYLI